MLCVTQEWFTLALVRDSARS